MFEQEGEGSVDRFGIDAVVVVQDEHEIVRDGGDFIDQGRQNRFDRRLLRGLEIGKHPGANLRRNRLHSRDYVR